MIDGARTLANEYYRRVTEWMMKQPNVIFAIEGEGIGWDGVFMSFHKTYSDYTEFVRKHNSEFSGLLIDCQSFISNLAPKNVRKPFQVLIRSDLKPARKI